MKKVVLVLGFIFCITVVTSCTDQTNELEERIELENEVQLIDPEDDGEQDVEDDDAV